MKQKQGCHPACAQQESFSEEQVVPRYCSNNTGFDTDSL